MKFDSMLKDNEMKNYEGGEAFKMTPEMELYTAVVTSSLSDKFYEKNDERMWRIFNLVKKVKPEFVAKLAVYTRNDMNLRSVPLLLVTLLAKIHNGDNLVKRTIEKTVLRADEIMELLMCYQVCNPQDGVKKLKKLSRQIQNGLKTSFNRFDEYQFAKYNRDSVVKLRDALFLVHPKAKDEKQQEIFDKIVNKKLEIPYTWETELSALGQQKFETDEQKQSAFCAKWEELIFSGKVGYMALLRNLRNILSSNVSCIAIDTVVNRLSDAEQVQKSKQMPFRFLSAYREIKDIENPNTHYVGIGASRKTFRRQYRRLRQRYHCAFGVRCQRLNVQSNQPQKQSATLRRRFDARNVAQKPLQKCYFGYFRRYMESCEHPNRQYPDVNRGTQKN